jgi:hypothetical protein
MKYATGIEKDWCSQAGQKLVISWGKSTGFFERQGLILGHRPGSRRLLRKS